MTTRSRPILSVLVPTKDRADYALPTIRTLLSFKDADFEVVVSDNSGTDALEDALAGIRDSRLRYIRLRQPLDVVANFSTCTQAATGEYVTAIGDDDGINPELLPVLRWALAQGYDAVVPTRPARYYWPDFRSRHRGASCAGTLDLLPWTGAITSIDPSRQILRCLETAATEFDAVPRVYYGCVRRSCLEALYREAGSFYPGPSPDLANAVAVSKFVQRACRVDYPLILPGSSARSTAGLGAMKQHVGRLEDWPHLPADSVRNWSEIVPRFFSGRTIWGEDVVQALRHTGQRHLLSRFNVPLLYAMCFVFHPEWAELTAAQFRLAMRAVGQNRHLGYLRLLAGIVRVFFWRLRSYIDRRLMDGAALGRTRLTGLNDVGAAITAIQDVAQRRQALLRLV